MELAPIVFRWRQAYDENVRPGRYLATLLVLLAVAVPVLQYASAPSNAGHGATLRHAPRTPTGAGRVAVAPAVHAESAVQQVFGRASAPHPEHPVSSPLAAPFVPPRG